MKKVPRIDISLNETDEPKAMQRPYISKCMGTRSNRMVKENTNFVKLAEMFPKKNSPTPPSNYPQSTTLKVKIKKLIQSISSDTPDYQNSSNSRR